METKWGRWSKKDKINIVDKNEYIFEIIKNYNNGKYDNQYFGA